jgi:hypothetical protein
MLRVFHPHTLALPRRFASSRGYLFTLSSPMRVSGLFLTVFQSLQCYRLLPCIILTSAVG